jgi:hypothetical protein
MARTFPQPWTFEENNNACFVVRDANKFPVAYVYFEDEPGRRASANLMTKDEARRGAARAHPAVAIPLRQMGESVEAPPVAI